MSEQIKLLRKELSLTQEEFSSKIGLSRNFIAQLESGAKIPSDRTINDICREFNVREEWLKTGEGEMFVQLTRKQKIVDMLGDSVKNSESFKASALEGLAELDEKDWEDIERIVMKFLRLNKEKE